MRPASDNPQVMRPMIVNRFPTRAQQIYLNLRELRPVVARLS